MTNAELGKLMRNNGESNSRNGHSGAQLRALHNQQQQQQLAAATRNLYNKQQPLQYAPTHNNRRQFSMGQSDELAGYNPLAGAASNGRGSSQADDDDEEGGSRGFGPNFGANFDGESNDGEGSQADGGNPAPLNLNSAASGYPSGDYNEQAGLAGLDGYDGADFGPSNSYDGRRAKSASSLLGRGAGDEDAGAPQFGPNSAINAGEADDEGRAGYAPDSSNDGEGDDD